MEAATSCCPDYNRIISPLTDAAVTAITKHGFGELTGILESLSDSDGISDDVRKALSLLVDVINCLSAGADANNPSYKDALEEIKTDLENTKSENNTLSSNLKSISCELNEVRQKWLSLSRLYGSSLELNVEYARGAFTSGSEGGSEVSPLADTQLDIEEDTPMSGSQLEIEQAIREAAKGTGLIKIPEAAMDVLAPEFLEESGRKVRKDDKDPDGKKQKGRRKKDADGNGATRKGRKKKADKKAADSDTGEASKKPESENPAGEGAEEVTGDSVWAVAAGKEAGSADNKEETGYGEFDPNARKFENTWIKGRNKNGDYSDAIMEDPNTRHIYIGPDGEELPAPENGKFQLKERFRTDPKTGKTIRIVSAKETHHEIEIEQRFTVYHYVELKGIIAGIQNDPVDVKVQPESDNKGEGGDAMENGDGEKTYVVFETDEENDSDYSLPDTETAAGKSKKQKWAAIPAVRHAFCHCHLSPRAMAMFVVMRILLALPPARLAQNLSGIFGFHVPVNTVSHWMQIAAGKLEPIYDLLKEELIKLGVMHVDGTYINICREKGRKDTDKSYVLMASSLIGIGRQLCYFVCYPGRKGEYIEEQLGNFAGIIIRDAYAGYNVLKKAIHALCLIHCRRYFYRACSACTVYQQQNASYIVSLFDRIFELEESFKGLESGERMRKRNEKVRPIMDLIRSRVEILDSDPLVYSSGSLKRAVTYFKNNQEGLYKFLEYDIPCHNQTAEHLARKVALIRKNSPLFGSPNGARCHMILMSVIYSAEMNGLDPYTYLTYVFEKLRGKGAGKDKELLKALLPWAEGPQKECRQKNTSTAA